MVKKKKKIWHQTLSLCVTPPWFHGSQWENETLGPKGELPTQSNGQSIFMFVLVFQTDFPRQLRERGTQQVTV